MDFAAAVFLENIQFRILQRNSFLSFTRRLSVTEGFSLSVVTVISIYPDYSSIKKKKNNKRSASHLPP